MSEVPSGRLVSPDDPAFWDEWIDDDVVRPTGWGRASGKGRDLNNLVFWSVGGVDGVVPVAVPVVAGDAGLLQVLDLLVGRLLPGRVGAGVAVRGDGQAGAG